MVLHNTPVAAARRLAFSREMTFISANGLCQTRADTTELTIGFSCGLIAKRPTRLLLFQLIPYQPGIPGIIRPVVAK